MLRVNVCGSYSHRAGVLKPQRYSSLLTAYADCGPNGEGLITKFYGLRSVRKGAAAGWETTAPAGIQIHHVKVVQGSSHAVGESEGWWGEFYWDGGPGVAGRSARLAAKAFDQYGCCNAAFNARHIRWFIACEWRSCSHEADLNVYALQLTATETAVPRLRLAGALWTQDGWVRGALPLDFGANDPSGICDSRVALADQAITATHALPDQAQWQQCPEVLWSRNLDTTLSTGTLGRGEGAMPLVVGATNAAGNSTAMSFHKTVYADNITPAITLSGPRQASAAAGAQRVSATATAGPSGVSGISCSTDGAPYQWHASASTFVPVSGVGMHTVTCVAQNNARDAEGNLGTSPPVSFTVAIRQPTVVAAEFTQLKDALRCAVQIRVVRVRGRWVVVMRHGKPVAVHHPAHSQRTRVRVCRPRLIRKRVLVHGHWRIVRVPVFPHIIARSAERVAFGNPSTVSGWLGTTGGIALGGQRVRVLAGADDGLNRFHQVAIARTRPNGTWSARLPAGPSRLIEASYRGATLLEPSRSPDARITVPARVRLRIRPRHVDWGSAVVISGRVLGGYIPHNKREVSQLLRLRIGAGGISQTAGIPALRPDGRFRVRYCFSSGRGTLRYWFTVSTLRELDYPYTPAGTSRRTVTLGPGNRVHPC